MPSEKTYDVLVAGELNVDLILNGIHKFPEIGKEVLSDRMDVTLGSSSAIFASNLSTLGTRVAFCGALARDQFGDIVLTSLNEKGVNTDHIVFTDQKGTGITVALSVGEDRAMITYPGAMTVFDIRHIPDDVLRRSKHLHVSSIFLSTGLKSDIHTLFAKARSFGLTTSLDPQWDPEEKWDIDFPSLLKNVDVFIPNEAELRAITGLADVEDAVGSLRPYTNVLIVKKGRAGASLWRADEIIHQPAFVNSHVVDSIGAGDSFDAGFIHQFIQGRALKECLEFGALTGAISTTRAGGTSAFESAESVRRIAAERFGFRI